MKVISGESEVLELIEDSILTPYIRCDKTIKGEVEFGYCKVNETNEVIEKYMIECEFKDIIINPLHLFHIPVYMMVTDDAYIRFWIDNVNFYLTWKINKNDETITLKIIRRQGR